MGMMDRFRSLRHAWQAFSPETGEVQTSNASSFSMGPSSSSRPDRPKFRVNAERTIISSIYTRMAIDVASNRFEHCKVDENGLYQDTIKSGLNECLTVAPNIDQQARQIRQDIALTMFTAGVAAIIPVETTMDPTTESGQWDIKQIRVGEVIQWAPEWVQVRVYNQKRGQRDDIWLPKSMVAIVENPFYGVMNEPNSTLQRLIHKLNMLDNIDEITSSGKLDIIIQLPYVVKSEARKNQAETRRQEIETQLQGSTYGIAYTDGTEKITQLNRSVENNLLEQVKLLKEELYNELGLTAEIMNGTADDVAMLNYMNRTIEPICDSIVESMIPKFLTKTARTQGQTIMYFQQPFKMIPISKLAEVADVLSRNQIATPNELRQPLGLKPSKQPQANQLVNSNMPIDKQITGGPQQTTDTSNTTIEQVPNQPPLALPAGSSPADIQERSLDKTMADLGIQ